MEKTIFSTVSSQNKRIASNGAVEGTEEYLNHKSKKYHYKNGKIARHLMAEGKAIPEDLVDFLQPYKSSLTVMSGGNRKIASNGAAEGTIEYAEHKARKYHYRNGKIAKRIMAEGKTVPDELLSFLQPYKSPVQ